MLREFGSGWETATGSRVGWSDTLGRGGGSVFTGSDDELVSGSDSE